MAVRTEALDYVADGVTMRGLVAWDDALTGRRPGVFLAHEANGRSTLTETRAQRLAALGYVALAGDLFGEKQTAADLPGAMALMAPLREDPARLHVRAKAGLDALKAHPQCDADRVAAIGFCFGGFTVLEIARAGLGARGVVSFHGALDVGMAPAAPGIATRILVCAGADDPLANAEQRDALQRELGAAGADWQMIVYGGAGHSFTNVDVDALGIPGFAYDARTDERSWRAMREFFDEMFAG
ncbi:dienelactone hydrolase family protein [Zavarzinia sp. CC-PAN008]|uniref:dienelactone hydrolase family protein n=1 Tax=Zavarzinia sp. CC-PAN008 TaxID=3243332 RepID=UPI003F746D3F